MDAARPENRAAALAELRADQFAPSGRGPRRARWNTWVKLHMAWIPEEPVLPLSVDSIEVVMASLKRGKYRSADDYMSTAKDMHLRLYDWSSRLARQQRASVRSALRGLGPAHQCAEIPLLTFVKAASAIEDRLLLVGFVNGSIIAYFFVLREIELSTMVASSVTFDHTAMEVSILLPATKVDPMALSCTRTWGCVCDGTGRHWGQPCPYHAAASQLELLTATFGDDVTADCFPFLPTVHGDTAKKEQVVDAVQEVATQAGLPLVGPDGRLQFTGHIFRISGPRHLARAGVQVSPIALLARWSSDVVLRYLQDTPLAGITADYRKKARVAKCSGAPLAGSKLPLNQRFSKKVLAKVTSLTKALKAKDEEVTRLGDKIRVLESMIEPMFIVSDKCSK